MSSRKKVLYVELVGVILIIVLGFVFHDLYKNTNNFLIGIISPVNESKWEHWKIAYWPMIIISILEYPFIKDDVNNFIFSTAIGILIFEIVTFGLVELYEVFFGEAELGVHITTYVIGAIVGQIVSYLIMTRTMESKMLLDIGIMILAVQFIIFLVFTFNPPKIEYFKDSLKGTYGIFNES